VTRGHDPSRAVHTEAVVALGEDLGLGCVNAHPDPDCRFRRPLVIRNRALRCDSCADRGVGAPEREQAAVALHADLLAGSCRDRFPEQPPLIGEDLSVPVVQLPDETRRAFDVGEEKRDPSGWKSRSHRPT
jgi:hypothetical protein